MFWKRTLDRAGATFWLYRNKYDEESLCKIFLTIELLEDIDHFKEGMNIWPNTLIGEIEANMRDSEKLTEEEIKRAINILCHMQYEER